MRLLSSIRHSLSALTPGFMKPQRASRPSKEDEPVDGYPANLGEERLNRVCVEHFGSPIRLARYNHLSAWKSSGAYRLFLTLDDERQITLVFKDAVYDIQHIPALERLPIRPGPPEYSVFCCSGSSLARLASRAYLAEEIIPQVHYQYLLEDLREDYHTIRSDSRVLQVVDLLPGIHLDLCRWYQDENPRYLIDFGPEYHHQLFSYVRTSLDEYNHLRGSKNTAKALQLLDQVEEMHAHRRAVPDQARVPIHGDLNYSNVFVHNHNHADIKLVDWEWAGIDVPHADLVSLLKGLPPALETQALQRYIDLRPEVSPADHSYLYAWSKVERGLLDAGFLATQALRDTHEANFNLHSAVSSSLNRFFNACGDLAS